MTDIRTYPTSTANQNVPRNVFLLAEISQCSGEIKTTYYIDRDGNMFKCGDWVTDKPHPITFSEIWRQVGDTPQMISRRWAQWLEG